MSVHEVNRPEVVEELRAVFADYEAALLRNDIPALNGFFWDSPHTVRYGLAEHGHGIDAIRADRARCAPADPKRMLRDTVITTLGADLATVCTLFESPGSARIGRQTQTWARLAAGWRIVAAHVSHAEPVAARAAGSR